MGSGFFVLITSLIFVSSYGGQVLLYGVMPKSKKPARR